MYTVSYNPSNLFAREYPPILKTACINKDNSLHLGRKYVRIFVLGHYLFLVARSFPQALLSENCLLLGTDNVRGQISEHIFAPNGGYCLFNGIIFLYSTLEELNKNLSGGLYTYYVT